MAQSDIKSIMRPIFTMSYILGINVQGSSFSLEKKKTYSLFLIVQRTCIFVAHIVLVYFYFRDQELIKDFKKATSIQFLASFRILGYLVILTTAFLFINQHIGNIKDQFKQLLVIDRQLQEMGQQSLLAQYNKSCKRKVYLLIIVSVVVGIVIEVLPGGTFWRSLIYFLLNQYPKLAITSLNISFYVITMLLENRFIIINRLLRNKVDESLKTRKYPVDNGFIDDIQKIVTMHKNLVIVSKRINYAYAIQLLLCITMNFVLLIGDLHTTMFIVLFNLTKKHLPLVYEIVRNTANYCFEFYYLAKRCTDLCHEANSTKNILLGIKIHMDKEEERNAVIVSTLKLMQNKLEITACKMFSVDNALLFSISGAASSYLFIMLQLDMGNANSTRQLLNQTNTSTSN